MRSQRTAGLLVIHNGGLKVERYGLQHHADAPWLSFFVTKSVISMLFGAALKDGEITSIDDPICDYLPIFLGSPYTDVSIKNILQMSSGLAIIEDYGDPDSNIVNRPAAILKPARFSATTLAKPILQGRFCARPLARI